MATRKALCITLVVSAGLLAACGGAAAAEINRKPDFLGPIQKNAYDGVNDDLLTAGLGRAGIQGAAPLYGDPANPTAAELRRNTIHSNYRALVDVTTNGGYGRLFGPNVDNNGNAVLGDGKIAGDEYLAYSDDGSGQVNVTLMVQVPVGFDKFNPCIVTATSSGSRGVYGAIGTAGDWGLKQRCAVAYSDKGSGIGFHNLQSNTVNLMNGTRANADMAGKSSNFTTALKAKELAEFNAAYPNRFALKQAHSQQNSERDWGKYTLQAVEFAFYVLNEKFGDLAKDGSRLATITPSNTIVIASSASNGAGAALLAAEQDSKSMIDGVAVSEPVTEVALNPALVIKRGSANVGGAGKHLFDTMTIANLYQPCAALSASLAASPLLGLVNPTLAANRCAALKAKGLLTGNTQAELANESLQKLRDAGWEADSDLLHASHYGTFGILAMFYANMYGKFGVADNVCGYSVAPTVAATGALTTLSAAQEAQLFATANGTPSGGIALVNNDGVGGPRADAFSASPSTGTMDYNIDGAVCLRNLATGTDITTGAPLAGKAAADSRRVRAGMADVLRSANLRGKPAIVVHGRNDTLIPVNHNSRAYFAANKLAEGAASKLSYVEITNAQHFDAFLGFPGYDTRLIPIHAYHIQAMNLMYAHLKNGSALPPSQVVRTVPRGGSPGAAPALTGANLPPILAMPASADRITFSNNTAVIPE